ncbi:histidine phosphatase family protein [Oceanobacillus arenosus]|uniref:Histidine phosphatase family protein n=1 Tax=Oceanobacillus arenosus TaxID=1229153 RepID=A0A3D8PHU1_9BACI|nr:histidine phosphatase family protein [Oceanobacillus arenosus]RDW15212.1 histidine phosphatase family protein [Oceanobacillus arenosus]
MTTICLVRHGETDWNLLGKIQGKTDIPLNDTGRKQADECGAYLNADDYDILISSPMKRAKETAEIINSYLNLPVIEMADFAERAFGDGEGLTLEERIKKYPDGNYPNQEEREDFNNRVMTGIKKVCDAYPNERVLLVAHGAVIGMILSNLSNGEIGSGKTKLMNACISNIHFEEDQWEIKDYNQVRHLSSFAEKGSI